MRPRRVSLGYGAADYQWYRECAASMRPRRVRLGDGLLARRCVVAALDASMRPRRVRLGDGFELDRVAGHFGASMRPRRVRLGYAPALEPLALPVHRFNEAQTLRPGRYPYLRGIGEGVGGASMRPGWIVPRNAVLLSSCQRAEKS